MNDAVFLLDDSGFIDCNRDAEEMFGATRAQLLHKMPYRLSPPVQPDGRKSRQKALEKIRLASQGNSQWFEWRHRKLDGTLFDTEVGLNRVVVEGKPVVLAVVRDISERKKAEDERLETEQMFRAIVENSHAGIFTIDENFTITYANEMTSVMLARLNDEITGHDFREMLDEESVKLVAERYVRRQLGEDVPSRYEFNIVQKNGNKRRVEISSTIFRSASGKLRTVGQVLDITERKKAEADLLRAHEELESRVVQRTAELSQANRLLQSEIARRTLVEEALRRERDQATIVERNRLARDLHDAVSQTLLSASLISEVLPRLWERDMEEGRRRLEEVRQLTRGALAEMRTLLLELRPDSLAEAEIEPLLKQLAESITGRSRVPVNVSISGRCPLPVAVKIALYRIAQEALNNVAKHAGAGCVDVRLSCRGGRVTLSVSDDGKGFEMKKPLPNTLGLNIMRERAREIGAAISVRSRPSMGTKVRVAWNDASMEAENE